MQKILTDECDRLVFLNNVKKHYTAGIKHILKKPHISKNAFYHFKYNYYTEAPLLKFLSTQCTIWYIKIKKKK